MIVGSLAGLAPAVVLVVSCAEPRPYDWTIRFADDASRRRTVAVTAAIRSGGCQGEAVAYEERLRPGDSPPRPPSLAPGTYGFAGIAYAAFDETVAAGCIEVVMPSDDRTIQTILEPVAPADGDGDGDADGDTDADADADGEPDADADAGSGADADADADGAEDGGGDASADADVDAGPALPAAPLLVAPWNGVATGSVRADGSVFDPPLRPEVRWHESPGALSYALEMVPCDDLDLALCDFAAPPVRVVVDGGTLRARPATDLAASTDPPVGARHALRVGACADASGNECEYSAPRYVDVGRVRQDVDGDGYGDLFLVGEAASGARTLRRTVGTTGPATDHVETGSTNVRSVGWVGDYDADGVGEIAVGVGGEGGGGWVYLDGLAVVGGDSEATPDAGLGARVAGLGDVDGDGYADFAVSAAGLGEVRVQLGGPTFDAARRVIVPSPAGTSGFPLDLAAAGDRNGDGLADLVAASRVDAATARLHVFSLAGRVATEIETADLDTGEPAPGVDQVALGTAVDCDDDGVPDIPVGRRALDDIAVRRGDRWEVTPTWGDSLGASVTGGDLDGTGRGRFVAGAPDYVDMGRATGATFHIARTGDPFAGVMLRYFNEEHFGQRVAVVDLDGDGREDIASMGDTAVHLGYFDAAAGAVGGTASFFMAYMGPEWWRDLAR